MASVVAAGFLLVGLVGALAALGGSGAQPLQVSRVVVAAPAEHLLPVAARAARTSAPAVSAAWLVPLAGTQVAGLWGGSTLAAYRGRGIYRALVSRRAHLALERGYSTLQVDASDDSRPILERLGLHTVGRSVPYVPA